MAGNDASTSSAQDVVMEEEVDPGYEPGQKEIDEYATWLGMDPEADKELLWIAREGLKVRCHCGVARRQRAASGSDRCLP